MKKLRHSLAAAVCGALLIISAPATMAAPQAQEGAPSADHSKALYWEGHQALARSDWAGALAKFRELEAQLRRGKTEPLDATYYWQAYALEQSGRTRESAAKVKTLRSEYPDSAWLYDADVLISRGDSVTREGAVDSLPERDADALMAMDALLVGGNQRGVPLLKKVLASEHSDRVKSRAMFVLSQLDSTAAESALDAILTGSGSPALKQEAIRMIAVGGRESSLERLLPVYQASADTGTRRAVIEAFLIGERADLLVSAMATESDSEVRQSAIDTLGAMGEGARLKDLYGQKNSQDERARILIALGVAGERQALIDITASETDPRLQMEAVRGIGIAGGPEAGRALVTLYQQAKDDTLRAAVIEALMIVGDEGGAAKALLDLYRKETNPGLRKKLMQAISVSDSDAALDMIDEALKR